MTDTTDQKSPTTAELIGVDGKGKTFTLPVGPDDDPTRMEARVRSDGGRVHRTRVVEVSRSRPRGVSAEEFSRFNELLASAVRRDVPLLDGIRDLGRTLGTRRFRDALHRVGERLERGSSAEQAFAEEHGAFPPLYSRLIAAGIAAGNLPRVLLALSRNIRTDAAFRRGVVEACVYPMLVFVVCCVFLTGFAGLMMPRIHQAALDVSLTSPGMTDFMDRSAGRGHWLIGAVLVAVIAGLVWAVWRHKRRLGEMVARRLVLYRRLYEAALWSNAADTLSLLVQADTPAPAALRLAGAATGSNWVCGSFDRLAHAVEHGRAMDDASRDDPQVPLPFRRALDSAAAGGDLAASLNRLAVEYRETGEQLAERVVRILPPVLAIVFGLLVFATVLTVLGPIISIWGVAW